MNIIEYYTESLPQYILDSEHYKDWRDLCPENTIYYMDNDIFANSLSVSSNDDFYQILKCDANFLFSSETRIQLLGTFDNYWRNDPNSAQLVLPKKGASYFGDQVIELFTTKGGAFMIMMSATKHGYRELFEYIYARDGREAFYTNHPFCVFPLMYYAICSKNHDILRRGIELNAPFKFSLIEPAIDKNNIEALQIVIQECKRRAITVTISSIGYAAKNASRETFAMILDAFVVGDINDFFAVNSILYDTLASPHNLEELVVNRGFIIRANPTNIFEYCIEKSLSIEAVRLMESHLGVSLTQYRASIPREDKWKNYISDNIVKADNYELYMYMRSCGFWVCDHSPINAIDYGCLRITPGLLKHHYNQDNSILGVLLKNK